jgi:hypothetical protein
VFDGAAMTLDLSSLHGVMMDAKCQKLARGEGRCISNQEFYVPAPSKERHEVRNAN